MVASRNVKIPFTRSFGRQRGRKFDVLAQIFAETASSFLCRYMVPAARRVGADFLEIVVPENADNVSGRKNFNTAAKNDDKLLYDSWLLVAGDGRHLKPLGLQTGSFHQNLQNKPVGRELTILQTFITHHVKQFSIPNFCSKF